jgi:hypothetical protein
MKIEFHIRGLNATASLRHWLEQPLNRLRGLVGVSTADVVIERQREVTPPFRAFVHLAVPGPDLRAEAREHTLEAVWLKVISALRKEVGERAGRRKARAKCKRRLVGCPNRRGTGTAGARA